MPHSRTITTISKCAVFLLAALILSNCCLSGSGCAPAAGTPVAWDGLGPAPEEATQQPLELKPKPHTREKTEIVLGPLDGTPNEKNRRAQPKDSWEQQQTAEQDDDAKLKRKLMICRTCLAGESARGDATTDNR